MPVNNLSLALSDIQSDVLRVGEDRSLRDEINFDERADSIDFIGFHIVDRINGLLQMGESGTALYELKQQAEAQIGALAAIDTNLFARLRENIRTGVYTGSSFRHMAAKYVRFDLDGSDWLYKIGYDNLDVFIDGLLSYQVVPEPTARLEPEMIFLQKTPARIIFQLVELAGLKEEDVFFDIGAGLGQAALLVNLLSGASARGIEYEPVYCSYATNCALALNLPNVEFINSDARKADYTEGTVFFMYTPFKGRMLQDMLEILKKESQKRAIRIFTYGPCSPELGQQSWLHCENGTPDDFYKLYLFTSLQQ
jgi:SAM-dependent methyltransferase